MKKTNRLKRPEYLLPISIFSEYVCSFSVKQEIKRDLFWCSWVRWLITRMNNKWWGEQRKRQVFLGRVQCQKMWMCVCVCFTLHLPFLIYSLLFVLNFLVNHEIWASNQTRPRFSCLQHLGLYFILLFYVPISSLDLRCFTFSNWSKSDIDATMPIELLPTHLLRIRVRW